MNEIDFEELEKIISSEDMDWKVFKALFILCVMHYGFFTTIRLLVENIIRYTSQLINCD